MSEFPRDLTALERESLLLLLPAGGFVGVDAYRQQADHARVVGRCPCGCPTIDLTVDRRRAPRASRRGAPLLPAEAHTPEGQRHPAELILFAPDGWLASLELVSYTEPPASLPPVDSWIVDITDDS